MGEGEGAEGPLEGRSGGGCVRGVSAREGPRARPCSLVAQPQPRRYTGSMTPFRVRARVGGFLVEVSPTLCPGLPPLALVLEDDGDELDEEDRVALNAVLEASEGALERGEWVTAEELLAELRAGRDPAEEEARPAPVSSEEERSARWGPPLAELPGGYTVRLYGGHFILLEPTDPDEELGPRRLMLDDERGRLSRAELAALEAVLVRALEAERRGSPRSTEQLAAELRPFGGDGTALDANGRRRPRS